MQLISSISRRSQYTIVLSKTGKQRHSWVSGEALHSYPKEAQNRHTNIKTEDYTVSDNNSIQMNPPSREWISLRNENPHLKRVWWNQEPNQYCSEPLFAARNERVQDQDDILFLRQELVLFILLPHCHSLKRRGSLGVISFSDWNSITVCSAPVESLYSSDFIFENSRNKYQALS